MQNFINYLKTKKKIIGTLFGVLLLTVSLGVGVYLVQNRQKTGVRAGFVDLTLSSNNGSPRINDTFVVAVGINTNGLSVNVADLRIEYDPNYLEAQSIEPIGDFLPNVLIGGSINNTTGKASIVLGPLMVNNQPQPRSGTGVLAQLVFKAKSPGSTSVRFGPETEVAAVGMTSNVVGNLIPVEIVVLEPTPVPTPTPTETPIPTPTPTETPTPTPTASPITLTITTDSFIDGVVGVDYRNFFYGEATPYSNSNLQLSLNITNAPPGLHLETGMCGSESPPGSILRAFCTLGGRPTSAGDYTVGITLSDNFGHSVSKNVPITIKMKTGDVDRNGSVNAVDLGLLIDNYKQTPLLNPSTDLTGDGKVTAVDLGILIDNFGK